MTSGAAKPQRLPAEGRIGLLGGTFNPVHIGHLRLALETAEAMGLARVDLLPCASPPHKSENGILPYALRVEILRAAVSDEPLLGVSTLENELEQPSYTWNTVHVWAERHGEPALFILGDEDFAHIGSWRHGWELPGVMDMAVVPRSGMPELFIQTVENGWPGRVLHPESTPPGALRADMDGGRSCWFLPMPRIELSATMIRRRWLAGLSLRYLLPTEALAVLNAHAETARAVWGRARL